MTDKTLEQVREYLVDFVRTCDDINRVEVVENNSGRKYVNHNASKVSVSLQDRGKTLKIFVNYDK